MGKITDKTKEAFDSFKESLENQIPMQECIGTLVKSMVEIADKSIQSAGNRSILDNEIEKQLGCLE